jgi:mRNA-degrading endonuclease RelE of RelBE toxin-antitoxin system
MKLELGAPALGICFLGGVLAGVVEEIGEGRKGGDRILYQIYDETITVVVVRIGHRRDAYR